MKLMKLVFLISLVTLLLICYYCWIMDHKISWIKSAFAYLTYAKSSHFKIKDLLVLPTSQNKMNVNESTNHNTSETFFIKHKQFYKCSSYECIVLSAVCCGSRANQVYTMMKSAIVLSKSPLIFELFIEEELFPHFTLWESEWPDTVRKRVKMNLHPAIYPSNLDVKIWKNLFKKCASLRLFYPKLLNDVESLIYVDTDIIFLAPPEEFWYHFSQMNASQMAGLVPEHEDLAIGWYNRFAKHPYFGKQGINSGVMLMNLTRMRSFGWVDYIEPIYKEFHQRLAWGDQDIINIIFHYHPDKLYVLGCEYNFRSDHCMYVSNCKAIESRGLFALHGSRGTFVTETQPAFKAVFEAWNKFKFEDDLRQDFYYPVSRHFILSNSKSNCGTLRKEFMKNIEKLVDL